MEKKSIWLEPLQEEDREQFILDNQAAFNYGALEEFGRRNDRFEEDGQIISRETIEQRISMDLSCCVCELCGSYVRKRAVFASCVAWQSTQLQKTARYVAVYPHSSQSQHTHRRTPHQRQIDVASKCAIVSYAAWASSTSSYSSTMRSYSATESAMRARKSS